LLPVGGGRVPENREQEFKQLNAGVSIAEGHQIPHKFREENDDLVLAAIQENLGN
jgi:hypothetical protein